jgi:MYXO-CTERM domain-containing protein
VVAAPEPEPIDLLDLAGGGAVQKYAIVGVAALVVVLLILAVRRRHRA